MRETTMNLARIARYSVGHGAYPSIEPGEVVLLVPQPAQGEIARSSTIRLAEAFDAARPFLRRKRRVRIVATGASLQDSWPEWVGDVSGLITTELGAYRTAHPIIATRDLSRDVHCWLQRVAGHADRGGGMSEMLYASLASRCVQPLFEAVSYAQGLADAHAGAEFHCVDAGWAGLDYLRALVEPNGGVVLPAASPARRRWRGRMAARLALRLALAIAGQLRRFHRSAPSRRALRRRRVGAPPRLWLALQPDWPRINRHVLAELDAGRTDYGILLTTTLAPGDVTRPGHGGPLWPGLPEDAINEGSRIALDQIAGPANLAMLAKGLRKGVAASFRASWRLMKADNRLLELAGGLHGGNAADGVARVLTTDLVQAVMVAEVTRTVAARHRMRGSTVVFANLNLTDTAAADRALRDAGAFTVDFRHGSGGGGWFGMHESFADYALVWSAADLALTAMLSRPAAVISPPAPPTVKRADPIRRVLVITGYSHDCWSLSGFPLRPFEIELLRGAETLSRHCSGLEIRWRPHPSDDPDEIAARLRMFPFLIRSDAANLADDLAWADLVISYGGTTLGQAVRAGLPVIAHIIPELLPYPDVAAIDPGRSFFYAVDLPDRFERLAEELAKDPEAAGAAGHRLFDALFAPSAATATITNLDFAAIR